MSNSARNEIVDKLFSNKAVSLEVFKARVLKLEDALLALPGATLRDDPVTPLKHTFLPGLYVREITIPKGFVLTTGIHKTEHIAIISKGKCLVATENGVEFIEAPCSKVTKIGTKRAILVLEDLVWTTVHAIDVTTPEEAIEQIEFKSYGELDAAVDRGLLECQYG